MQNRVSVSAALIKLLSLFFDVNAKEQTHQPHSQQNAANTKRIGHGIAHPHLINNVKRYAQIAQNLLPGPQRWRISDCTRENTEHHRQRDIKELMQHCGHQPPKDDNQDGKEIEP